MVPERLARVWEKLLTNRKLLGRLLEDVVEDFYSSWVKPGDVVFDVGANVGRHTIPLARVVGETGRVIAFEAAPRLVSALEIHLRSLPEGRWVDLRHAAVSDKVGKRTFQFVSDEPALSSLKLREGVASTRTDIEVLEVPTTTLDANAQVRPVTFIKIDVEGAEFSVFRGADALMARDRPVFAFEDGRHGSAVTFGYTLDKFYAFFLERDYVVCDTLGFAVDNEMSRYPGPWNFFAVPKERSAEASELILVAAFSCAFDLV